MKKKNTDRTALVTGGAKRLGFAIAEAIAREGVSLIITYRSSSKKEVNAALEALRKAGAPQVTAFRCDLTSDKELTSLAGKLRKSHPRIDYLVNSAGNFIHQTFGETTRETFDTTLALNLRAPFFLSQAVAEIMQKNGFGRIVNIADVAAIVPWTGYVAYGISKAGLIAMTRSLAKALAPEILVNCVAPGPVLLPEDFDRKEKAQAIQPTVLDREGSPEDVAKAVVFLLRSDYITGVTLPVDGGRLLR